MMGQVIKQKLTNRIWELVEPSTNGYSDLINRLMSRMTEEELQDVIESMEDTEEE